MGVGVVGFLRFERVFRRFCIFCNLVRRSRRVLDFIGFSLEFFLIFIVGCFRSGSDWSVGFKGFGVFWKALVGILVFFCM